MDSEPSLSPSPPQSSSSEEEKTSLLLQESNSSSPGTISSKKSLNSSVFDTEIIAPEANGDEVGNGSSGSSGSGSEEGFMSGEEEFENAPDRPLGADPDEGTLELGAKVVEPAMGSSNSPPMMDESHVVGNDGVVEPTVVRVEAQGLTGGLRVEEEREIGSLDSVRDECSEAIDNGVKDSMEIGIGTSIENLESDGGTVGIKEEDHIGKSASIEEGVSVVDVRLVTGEERNVVSDVKEVGRPVEELVGVAVEETVDTELVESDKDENLKNERNSADETEERTSMVVAAGGCEQIDENQVSETESSRRLEVEGAESLEIGSEKAMDVVETANCSKSIDVDDDVPKVDGNGGATNFGSHEPVNEANMNESKTEIERVENDHGEMICDTVDEIVSTHPDVNHQNPEVESEQQTNLRDSVNELIPKSDVDGVELRSSGAIDGVDEAQTADSSFNSEKLDSIGNDKQEDGGQDKMRVHAAESNDLHVAAQNDAVEDDVNTGLGSEEDDEGSISEEETEGRHFKGSEISKQIMETLAWEAGASSYSGGESSQEYSHRTDGQIVMESDEEVDTDEEGDGKELFDSAALTALLKAATSAGSDGGTATFTSSDGSRLFSLERPAGLGSSTQSLKPAPRPNRPNIFTAPDPTDAREQDDKLSDEEKKKLEKIQLIRVKFLRLISRVGHSHEDSIAAQVLYRLVLAAGRHSSQAFSLETAKRTAMELEAAQKDDLDFSLNIIVLGKTGVGKSATINSIFGQEKAVVNAFEPATTSVKEIVGTVDGVEIRVFDTPGLRSSVMEQSSNQKILSSVKKLTKKYPPDILLYVDRLDTQTRDLNDLPLLRSITGTLGSSIWRSAIVTLTHAASAPPDGPSGSPLNYEVLVAQRSHIVQQAIGQAVGDLRMMNPSLMNPVSLVENHPACRRNREGQKILPNGQSWRSQLLLLCYSLKILSELSSLSKPQDPFDHRKLFGFRVRSPPLPYLLSSLLQSRAHPKLPTDQGENVDSDIELEDLSDSDQEEEEEEYDQLPPFKPLRKSQIAKLSKDQRKAYFDEYDYRVKLLQKKQWKEELRRMREMKKKGKSNADSPAFLSEDAGQEGEGPAAVPVPLPDMVLPPSFDGDNPAYRYRFLEPTSQLLARPVLDTHGWDHDCGYDGVSLEENLAIAGKFPAGVAVQITKDKKEFNIHLDSSVVAKHGENGSTMAGFDVQNIGKQLAYIVKAESKFKNLKKNKTAGGLSVTFLGENVVTGLKIEDQIMIGKRLILVGSTGTVRSQGDAAYGANLEARLKEKDFPIGQDQATLGLSLMRWRGDLALGANLQSQFSVGRSSKMSVRVGLNNKLSGQITVRISSSEQLQLALVGVLPIAMAIYRSIYPSAGVSYSAY